MPQPTHTDVHYDGTLTNISVGWMNEQSDYVATKVFPMVPSAKQSDRYWTYDRDFWFRDEAEKRAPGTKSKGGGYQVGTSPFYCEEWAYHQMVPWEVQNNADVPLNPDADATRFTAEKILMKLETEWMNAFFVTGAWSNDWTGGATETATTFIQWDDDTNAVPVRDIMRAKKTIKKLTGRKPNTLVVSEPVHMYLTQDSTILDRFKYTQTAIVTAAMMAAVFELDNYIIAGAVKATTAEGETAAYDWIAGNDALLLYLPGRPGVFQPAAGYTFYWSAYPSGIATRRIEMLVEKSDMIESSIYFDQKIISADLGLFFHNAISLAASS